MTGDTPRPMMRRLTPYRAVLALLLLTALTSAAQAQTAVRVLGAQRVSPDVVLDLIGDVPEPVTRDWQREAYRRVVRHYRTLGYELMRGWWAMRDADEGPVVELHIDEGQLQRTAVRGASAFTTVRMRMEFFLPDDIFHRPTLDAAMQRMIEKYNLTNAHYRVEEAEPLIPSPTGKLVEQRILNIYIISKATTGWDVGLNLRPLWGIVPHVSFAVGDLFWDADHLETRVGLGFPYRRYFADVDPQFQWVHGYLHTIYHFPPLANLVLTPFVEVLTALSRYERPDLEIDSYLNGSVDALINLSTHVTRDLNIDVGVGFEFLNIFDISMAPQATAPPTQPYANRSMSFFLARILGRYELGRNVMRPDLRKFIEGTIRLAYSSTDLHLIPLQFRFQWVENWDCHNLIFGVRAKKLFGTVNFWDQDPIADYIRVFFSNRYWVDTLAALNAAFRFSLSEEKVKVGIFHDLALFTDVNLAQRPARLANAFGPSLHFLVLQTLAINLYYGFGFAPPLPNTTSLNFSHNLSFDIRTIF